MDCEVNKSVFKGLIELNLIELPDYKRPHEADRVGDLLFLPLPQWDIRSKIALSWTEAQNKIKINEGTIDAELLKTRKKGLKVAASKMAPSSRSMDSTAHFYRILRWRLVAGD